jgi:hypothetical protein
MTTEKLLRQKRSALSAVHDEARALEKEIERLTRRLQEEKVQEAISDLATYTGGLNLIPIRDSLVGENSATDLRGILGTTICLLGEGPWDTDDFGDFLEERGFELSDPDHSFEVLVVGRSIDKDEETVNSLRAVLDYHIDTSEPLIVLSQELLVLALVKLVNPLELLSEDELHELAEGHAGLETVIDYEGFEWPFAEDAEDDVEQGGIFEFDSRVLNAESPLHRVGYTVAEGRLSLPERRQCLKKMFEIDGDEVLHNKDEHRIWGKAKTQQRLYAMARHISWLIGFRGDVAPNAADRWRSDLSWLKESYYRSGMKFAWPLVAKSSTSRVNVRLIHAPISSTWPFPSRGR